MARSYLPKPLQQDLSSAKVLFVLLMNCQASGQVPSLGLDLWWDSIMPQPPELGMSLPREAGCHSPHISTGHSDSVLVEKQRT